MRREIRVTDAGQHVLGFDPEPCSARDPRRSPRLPRDDLRLGERLLHPSRTRLRIRARPAPRAAPSRGSVGRDGLRPVQQAALRPQQERDQDLLAALRRARDLLATSGAPFPLSVAELGCCTDIAIDNTAGASAENLYYSPDGEPILGYTPAGAAFRPSPRRRARSAASGSTTKATSGPATSARRKIEEFEPTGGAADQNRRRRRQPGSPCRVRFDLSNNDMYVPQYSAARVPSATRRPAATRRARPRSSTQRRTPTSRSTQPGTSSTSPDPRRSRPTTRRPGSLLETFGEDRLRHRRNRGR